jgi:hypothetical protein
VRFAAALLMWVVTTVALAVAVPLMWLQTQIVSEDGYADLAASAAKDSQLQAAMASELTNKTMSLAADHDIRNLNPDRVHEAATFYTGNSGFPAQFAQANRIAHRWMFTDSAQHAAADNQWLIDVAPMLADPSFKATLGDLNLQLPDALTVPITVSSQDLQPGRLRPAAQWGPWVSAAAAVLAGVFALLALVVARSRGKAIAALGVSALLVGAAGWAAVEVAHRHVNDALNRTDGAIRQVAEVMINHAEGSLHQWFNLTLAAGGVLVVVGVVVSVLGGLRRKEDLRAR